MTQKVVFKGDFLYLPPTQTPQDFWHLLRTNSLFMQFLIVANFEHFFEMSSVGAISFVSSQTEKSHRFHG